MFYRTLFFIGVLLLGSCGTEWEQLAEVEHERDANEIIYELNRNGISQVQKFSDEKQQKKKSWKINVSSPNAPVGRGVLVTAGLPRPVRASFDAAVGTGGWIPSPQTEKAKLNYAVCEQLERTLETDFRIAAARVHVAMPEEKLGMRSETGSQPKRAALTASVTIRPAPQLTPAFGTTKSGSAISRKLEKINVNKTELGDERIKQIKEIVARAFQDLSPENVTVMMVDPPPIAAIDPPAEATSNSDTQLYRILTFVLLGLCLILAFFLITEVQKNRSYRSSQTVKS